eukprot:1646860-Prorocentrum_lima.AAC.1
MASVRQLGERECVEPFAPSQSSLQVADCALIFGMGGLKAKVAQLLAHLVVQRFPSGCGVPKHTEALS